MKTDLELLREKIKYLDEIQKNCHHDWGEEKKDVEVIDNNIFELHGIKFFTELKQENITVRCWSRECKKCGKKEYFKSLNFIADEPISKSK